MAFVSGAMLDEAKAALERIRCAANTHDPANLDDVEKLMTYFAELEAEPLD